MLAPTTMSIMFVAFSFILAGLIHPQEFYCLPYGVIYYITIPAMYLLLVIFSIFNLHDVSWGTREVKEDVKKTPEEMAEEQRQQEEAAAKAKNKKSQGLLGFLLHQANDKATEKVKWALHSSLSPSIRNDFRRKVLNGFRVVSSFPLATC